MDGSSIRAFQSVPGLSSSVIFMRNKVIPSAPFIRDAPILKIYSNGLSSKRKQLLPEYTPLKGDFMIFKELYIV